MVKNTYYEGEALVTKNMNDMIAAINKNTQDIADMSQNGILPITYNELKILRNNNQLIPNQQYRITDYSLTTNLEGTISANHPFDIIVTANSTNSINENARATVHEGDTYFQECNVNAWKIKYSLDNDVNRFSWAVTGSTDGTVETIIDGYKLKCTRDTSADNRINEWPIIKIKTNYTPDDGVVFTRASVLDTISADTTTQLYAYTNEYSENIVFYFAEESPDIMNSATLVVVSLDGGITFGSWETIGEVSATGYIISLITDYKYAWRVSQITDNGNTTQISDDRWIFTKTNKVRTNEDCFFLSLIDGETTVRGEYTITLGDSDGLGVIYYMLDEWYNERQFDFKNMMLTGYVFYLDIFGQATDILQNGAFAFVRCEEFDGTNDNGTPEYQICYRSITHFWELNNPLLCFFENEVPVYGTNFDFYDEHGNLSTDDFFGAPVFTKRYYHTLLDYKSEYGFIINDGTSSPTANIVNVNTKQDDPIGWDMSVNESGKITYTPRNGDYGEITVTPYNSYYGRKIYN